MSTPHSHRPRPARATAWRTVGMAMLGSALALATLSALAVGGVLPLAETVRPWVAAGSGVVAALDALIGVYFLRASSQP